MSAVLRWIRAVSAVVVRWVTEHPVATALLVLAAVAVTAVGVYLLYAAPIPAAPPWYGFIGEAVLLPFKLFMPWL